MKCFSKDKGVSEKMALPCFILSPGELLRAFRVLNTNKMHFFRVWEEMTTWAMDFLQISIDLIVL